MKVLNSIREFFWPLLEKTQIPESREISQEEITVDISHLEKTLEYAINYYEAETDRKKIVEGKSSLFIGIMSVATSVVIGITSILVKVSVFNIEFSVLVFLLFVLTVYMIRTIWFSIKALERKKYYSISIYDFLISDSDEMYYRKLIAEITNKVKKNSITINSKVDNMTMAQEYFKRAIVVVAVYALFIVLFFLSKSGLDYPINFQKFIETINGIKVSGWNTLILYILVISSFMISLYTLMRKKK